MLFNKRLFLVWALLVVAALMFVYCGDSDEPTEPTDPLAGAALCLSDDTCGVCPEGDTSTVIDVTNCGNSTVLDWLASESSDWFDLSINSGSTPGSFMVTADTNKTNVTRTGQIIVAGQGLAEAPETLLVAQAVYGSIVHTSIEEWTAAAEGDTSEAVQVTNSGNGSVLVWSADSDSSWLTLVPATGETPGEFRIVVDSNRSGDERTGTVSVTAAGLTGEPATIAVTQPTLKPDLCVSLTEWKDVPVSGGESEVILVTSCGDTTSFEWELHCQDEWLTTSVSSGSTPGSFTITVDENIHFPRTSYVFVTSEGISGETPVIRVNQLSRATLAGSYDLPDNAWGVYVSGGYAYVANRDAGLQIIDVSDPANPDLVGSYEDTPDLAFDVFVTGDYAYVADGYSGLQVFDVSDPTSPSVVGSYNTPSDARRVFVAGNYAYVADHGSGLQIIDVSDPAAPVRVGSYGTPDNAWDVFVGGGCAYVAEYGSGLEIILVSEPDKPTWIGAQDTPGHAYGVYVSGDYAYVADDEEGLQIIDVSNPGIPVPVACYDYDTPSYAYAVFVSGNYAFVADRSGGLQIIDVSNPYNPVRVGAYDLPGFALDVYVSGGYAYVGWAYEYLGPGGLLILKLEL